MSLISGVLTCRNVRLPAKELLSYHGKVFGYRRTLVVKIRANQIG